MNLKLCAMLSAGLALFAGAAATRPDEPEDPLAKGDLSAFELVEIGPDSIALKDGEVRVSGTPNGYFATKKSYKNYILTFEWMYERPETLKSDASFEGNSGLLIHIALPHKVWPVCIEVQLAYPDAGNIFPVGKAMFEGEKDSQAQKKAMKPVGEWNAEKVTCRDGAVSCELNGARVASGKGAKPSEGPIGWQSEGAPIRFRKIRIQTLD